MAENNAVGTDNVGTVEQHVPEDHFLDMSAIFFCEFDSIVGPVITCHYPPKEKMDIEDFHRIYHFLIIKNNDFAENGISWMDDISEKIIAGYPVLIENSKYARNALIFNLCLVGQRSANTSLLLCMAEKLARLLKSAELQFGFLSKSENRKEKLQELIENIFIDLKSKGETRRILENSFPFFVALPKATFFTGKIEKTVLDIKPTEIPFIKKGNRAKRWTICDCLGQRIVETIDGHTSVAQLSAKFPGPNAYITVTTILSQLVRFGLIGLRTTVNNWDMFAVTSKLSLLLTDDKLSKECIAQATKADIDTYPLVHPALLSNILLFMTQFQHGITVGDLTMRNKHLLADIDVTKLILFSLEHGLIRRVFVAPVFHAPTENRQAAGSIGTGDMESVFNLSTSSNRSLSQTLGSARKHISNTITSASEQENLDQAYILMDGNHNLEFIAARAGIDPGNLLKTVRSDAACELLLK